MIDFGKILKRAWQILWEYRTLWIFGLLLALTVRGGGNANLQHRWEQPRGDPQSLPPALRQIVEWFQSEILPILTRPEEHVSTLITIAVVVFTLAILFGTLMTIVNYVSQAAVMRMVNDYEGEGVKVGFRQGWRLGWNRRAFRMWLIDLILTLPVTLIFSLILGGTVILLISFLSAVQNDLTGLLIFLGIALALGEVFVFVLIAAFLNLWGQFGKRAAALDGLGTLASLQYGWRIFVRHWKSVILMWLITVGLGIIFTVGSMIAFLLLIPVYLLLLLPAVLLAAIPASIAFGIASLFTAAPLNWIISILVALPFFFTILFSPLLFLEALYQIYLSTLWTLTYREMKAIEAVPSAPSERV